MTLKPDSAEGGASPVDLNLDALKAALVFHADDGRTHWNDCYLDSRHRDCAIAVLLQEVDRLRSALAAAPAETPAQPLGAVPDVTEQEP